MQSIATHTRTLTVSQDTNNGSEVEAVVTSNRGELSPVTHSFPPSHQGGRGTTIERQPPPGQQPTKEVYLTPLCMNNSGTDGSPNTVSPHSGVHPTCLSIHRSHSTTFKSPRRGDGTPTRVTKEWMALWPVDHAAQVDTSKSPRTAPTCRLGSVT